jgi:hypothetical protein
MGFHKEFTKIIWVFHAFLPYKRSITFLQRRQTPTTFANNRQQISTCYFPPSLFSYPHPSGASSLLSYPSLLICKVLSLYTISPTPKTLPHNLHSKRSSTHPNISPPPPPPTLRYVQPLWISTPMWLTSLSGLQSYLLNFSKF